MNIAVESIIRDTASGSNQGRIHFGEVVSALLQVGVESYAVDYRASRATYYMPDGEVYTLEAPASEVEIAPAFSAEALVAAIRGAQSGAVMYPEFKRLSQAAGCVAYVVWLAGHHVSYFGRKGETHIENFPSQA